MEDQALEREKEIWRGKVREKRKNEYFSNEKEMKRLCKENSFTVSGSDYS